MVFYQRPSSASDSAPVPLDLVHLHTVSLHIWNPCIPLVLNSCLCVSCSPQGADKTDSADKCKSFTDLDFTIRQINAGPLIEAQLLEAIARLKTSGNEERAEANPASTEGSELRRRKLITVDNAPLSRPVSESPKALPPPRCVPTFVRYPLHIVLSVYRAVEAWWVWVVTFPFLWGTRFTDVSIFAQQIDRRFRETLQLSALWRQLRQKTSKYDERNAAAHVRFWGTVTRIGVDIVVGFITFGLLLAGSATVLRVLHYGGQILHLDVLQSQIRWLMEQPAGAKLNRDLSATLGSCVLFCLDFWNALTTIATPFEPLIIVVISCVGIFGLTLAVALATDLISIVTVHIDGLHMAFSLLYATARKALSALWKLFRGKKRNVLRGLIDTCDYDVDQLLLGACTNKIRSPPPLLLCLCSAIFR
jgi:hypothetical protein